MNAGTSAADGPALDDAAYLLVLSELPGVGPARCRQLLRAFGSGRATLAAGDDVTLDGANTFTGAVTFAGAGTSDITLVDSTAFDVQAGGLAVVRARRVQLEQGQCR